MGGGVVYKTYTHEDKTVKCTLLFLDSKQHLSCLSLSLNTLYTFAHNHSTPITYAFADLTPKCILW